MDKSDFEEILLSQRQMLEDAIRELQLQNQQLQKALGKVQNRNRELAQIAYQISHDLRGPVTSLMGILNLLRVDEDAETRQFFFENVPGLLDKIDVFARSLSSYSAVSNLQLQRSEVVWPSLVERIIRNIEEDINITLEDQSTEKLYSDEKRIYMIFHQLIYNSLKFNAGLADLKIMIRVTDHDDQLQIYITDNGAGIDELAHKNLFQMFYRASNKTQGVGLGLYIAKALANDLNGDLYLDEDYK